MKGIQRVSVSNRDAKFDFELHRNITIVRGDSGTGKTTLYTMIADYTRLGEASGVNISSDKKCAALVDMDWKNQLESLSDSIVFIDEGSDFISGDDFARIAKQSDNYYVIFNREGLYCLPYSVEEIYEIRTSGKYHKFVRMFKSDKKHTVYTERRPAVKKPVRILTEDSNAGFQFFERYCQTHDIDCESANSKSAIFQWLKNHSGENVFIIADGAAFGSEIDRVMKLSEVQAGKVIICLPESFEWLILKSGVIHTMESGRIEAILASPSDYIESREYFSWENFFAAYLAKLTQNTPFQYSKARINSVYLDENNMIKIISEIL